MKKGVMSWKRWFNKTMLVALSSAVVVVTGCGGRQTSDSGSASGGANKEQIVLTMMHPWTTPNVDNEVYKERIKKFQEENPNIKIETEEVPSAQYRTKLRTQATGKKLPDLSVQWPGAELVPLVEGGVLMPIDEIADYWKDLLPQDALQGFSVNGKLYSVPAKMTFVDIVYYHKELLAKVGYNEFPKTYSDFIEMVKKLKAAGITPIVNGNKDRWPLQSSYMSVIGDRFTGSDFLPKAIKGEAKFTDPEFVKALGVIEELTKLGAFNEDINTMDVVQEQDYFLQGKAAISITSSTIDAKYRHNNPNGDKIGIALFPAVEGGKGDPKKSAGIIQYGIGLNSELKGEKKEAALKFLKYFFSKEMYQTLVSKGIIVPAKVELPADTNKYLKEMIELTSKGTAPVFDSIVPIQIKESIENGLQAITMKQKTAEQVAQELQTVMDKLK